MVWESLWSNASHAVLLPCHWLRKPAGAEQWLGFSKLEFDDRNRPSDGSRCLSLRLLVTHGETAPFVLAGKRLCPFPQPPWSHLQLVSPFLDELLCHSGYCPLTTMSCPSFSHCLQFCHPSLCGRVPPKAIFAPWDEVSMCLGPQLFCWQHRDVTTPSSLLPYSGRSQSSQQSVIASGRLQLILLEGFHQSPLPKLLRGSPVTSQIPTCNRLQGQTLQPWDTRLRLSRQQNQPPKAQALCCISGSMISCCVFHAVPASFSKRVVAHCFPSPPHSSWAASGPSMLTYFELVLRTDLFPCRCSWRAEKPKALWTPPFTAPPLQGRYDNTRTARSRGKRGQSCQGPASWRALTCDTKAQLSRALILLGLSQRPK